MAGHIFFYHTNTCIGCGACQVACKDQNNLPPGEFFRRVLLLQEDGAERPRFSSVSCRHCAHPACAAVCPNKAFRIAQDGTVLHEPSQCIGCGRCVWSCPVGAISLSRERGVAQKCHGCLARREQGLAPSCVAACVNGSLRFGYRDV